MNFTKTYKTLESCTRGQKGTTESTEYAVPRHFAILNCRGNSNQNSQFMNLDNMIPKFIWKNKLSNNSQEKKIRKCNYFKDLG